MKERITAFVKSGRDDAGFVAVNESPIAAADSNSESDAANQGSQAVDDTVRRAIPYLERYGEAWIERHQCVSCHQIPFMLWGALCSGRAGLCHRSSPFEENGEHGRSTFAVLSNQITKTI